MFPWLTIPTILWGASPCVGDWVRVNPRLPVMTVVDLDPDGMLTVAWRDVFGAVREHRCHRGFVYPA